MHIAGGTESHSGRQLALKAGTERGRGEAPREGGEAAGHRGREGGREGGALPEGRARLLHHSTTVYHSVPQCTTVYHSVPQCTTV